MLFYAVFRWCHAVWIFLWFTATFFIIGSSSQQQCVEIPNNQCFGVLSEKYYAQNEIFIAEENLEQINVGIGLITGPCLMFIKIILCFYQYPPCDINTSELLPVCLTRCPELDEAYNECSQGVNIPIIRDRLPTLGPLILNYNCSDTDSYYGEVELNISTIRCSNVTNMRLLENLNTESQNSGSNRLSAGIIAAISIGCGLVVIAVFIVIIVALMTRRFKHRSKFAITRNADQGHGIPLGLPDKQSSVGVKRKMSAIEIDQFLRYVKERFSDLVIPTESITKLDSLGKGAFGAVHKGELLQADGSIMLVAIKTTKFVSSNSIRELVGEMFIMKNFDHPNVLSLLGACVDMNDDDMLKMILPFMSNGDLKNYLRTNRLDPTNTEQLTKNIDEGTLIKMCLDIAKGMEYLVSKRFVHRDLAARNCMVDENCNIRVADFGLTKDIYTNEYYRGQKYAALPVKWMSPESILDNYFNEMTDVWSYGITCWEIFSLGRIPYPGIENHSVIIMLKAGKRLEKPVLCPQKMYTLMQATWAEIPSERPTFEEIIYHGILCW